MKLLHFYRTKKVCALYCIHKEQMIDSPATTNAVICHYAEILTGLCPKVFPRTPVCFPNAFLNIPEIPPALSRAPNQLLCHGSCFG